MSAIESILPGFSHTSRYPNHISTYGHVSPQISRVGAEKLNQTDVFPVQSFQHPALLQAILALSSLQMAELAGDSPTASWLHYGLCIRRNAKNYQSSRRRAQPASLATTLLLAFYEVWISNHEKWCTHMIGARHIIGETPFRQMSMQVWAIHQQRLQQWAALQAQNPFGGFVPTSDFPNHELAEVDLDLVSGLTGRPVYFVEGADLASIQTRSRHCTDRDLENYEQMADLYWWFCKMDVYQATLGGSKLLYVNLSIKLLVADC